MRTLLGVDHDLDGFETRYYHDPENGKIIVQRLQDVSANLAQNKRERNEHSSHKASRYKKGGQHKVASIPKALVEQWMKEEGFNIFTCSDADLRKRLNSSEYSKLRTMDGRL